MKPMIKYIISIFLLISLGSCATKLSSEATNNEQQEVKQQILNLLEQEYKQPFKILDFKYEYKTHYPAGNCEDCRVLQYGTYFFKIESIDNSIVVIDFNITDKNGVETAINNFKKRWLDNIYCSSFGSYWDSHHNDSNDLKLQKAEEYCDDRGQTEAYDNFWTK